MQLLLYVLLLSKYIYVYSNLLGMMTRFYDWKFKKPDTAMKIYVTLKQNKKLGNNGYNIFD